MDSKRLNKHQVGSLLLVAALLVGFIQPVFAKNPNQPGGGSSSGSCSVSGIDQDNIFAADKQAIKNFNQKIMFEGGFLNSACWSQFYLPILSYILAPVFLITLILYGILREIELFGYRIQVGISVLIALISAPTVLHLPIAYLVNLQVTGVLIFVFAIMLMGLSAFYRRKALDYDFFMGSRIGTILIVHAPLILLFALAGIWAAGFGIFSPLTFSVGGGSGGAAGFGPGLITVLAIAAVIGGVLIIQLIKLLEVQYVTAFKWGIIIAALVAGVLIFGIVPSSAQEGFYGAIAGAVIGVGFAGMEWARRFTLVDVNQILESGEARIENLEKRYEEIEQKIEDLRERKMSIDTSTQAGDAKVQRIDQRLNQLNNLAGRLRSRMNEIQEHAQAYASKKVEEGGE